MKDKVSQEIAIQDFDRFVENSGIETTDENFNKLKSEIVGKIVSGKMFVDENGEITVNLRVPYEGINGVVKSLKINNRTKNKEIRMCTKLFSHDDSTGNITGNIAARVGESTGIIDNLDAIDFNNLRSIALLFM